jgi:hypothetical protein
MSCTTHFHIFQEHIVTSKSDSLSQYEPLHGTPNEPDNLKDVLTTTYEEVY